jgi:hypothetical protein
MLFSEGHGLAEQIPSRFLISTIKGDAGICQKGHESGLVKPICAGNRPHFAEVC